MAGALVGILSPLVLFPDQMWSGNGPTLTGQYVFKDIVLVAGRWSWQPTPSARACAATETRHGDHVCTPP
jgi:hypothetical protein